MTCRHEDQPQGSKSGHNQEAFSTTKDIQNFCQWNVYRCWDSISNNVNDVDKRVGLKVARDIRDQIEENRTLEGINKIK